MVNSSLYNLLYKGGQSGGSKIKSTFKNFSSLLNGKKRINDNDICELNNSIRYYLLCYDQY